MPIFVTEGLSVAMGLRDEGLSVREVARPEDMPGALRIALVNLMPEKGRTELLFARHLAATHRDVALTLVAPDGYLPRHTAAERHDRFYRPWSALAERDFDGLIVTGAPVETLPFEAVAYWQPLTALLDWAQERVHRSLFVCWAGQAALWHHHGVPKHALPEKCFGVFAQRSHAPVHPVLAGLGESFPVPVSRHTETRAEDLPRDRGLSVLVDSPESGLCLIEDRPARALYMFNHFEYDAEALAREYRRDLAADLPVPLPANTFPGDDPGRLPERYWRPIADRFFTNWLGEMARTRPSVNASRQRSGARSRQADVSGLRSSAEQCFAGSGSHS